MFARLWWKEARQAWPAWGLLAAAGMAAQSYSSRSWGDEVAPGVYGHIALVVTMMYLFLIAAAAFAGERENGTLWILDAMPAGRLRVWSAKASFALATTLALGALLWLSALAFGRDSPEWRRAGIVAPVWGLTALGWGLLWSAVLPNALHAAVLAMASLGLTLFLFVDLQGGPSLEGTGILLPLAALTTGASAWAFGAGGPPGRGFARGRRRPEPRRLSTATAPGEPGMIRRPARVWPATVPRLLWETLRQVRAELRMLVGLAIAVAAAPYLIVWTDRRPNEAAPFALIGAAILSLVAGVLAFNAENRGRTHRFLLHHGARPGVVWAVKVAVWWVTALALWAIAIAPAWLPPPAFPPRGASGMIGYGSIISWGAAVLTIPFAIAVACGMAFRRGIVAGMIAVVASLAVVAPMLAGLVAQVLFPWHWPYVAVGLLAVGWAWSADWLHDASGWGRWARLALYAAAVPAVLVPLYIADRARGVPELPPKQAEAFFRRSRVVAPVPEENNAAPLYREAYRLISRDSYPTPEPAAGGAPAPGVGGGGMAAAAAAPAPGLEVHRAPAWALDLQLLDDVSFDPPPDGVTAWLERLEPALAKLREGSRRPACRYMDFGTATGLDRADEPPIRSLLLPLAVSARARLARGDLDGAWVEVEALARMARQYSYGSPWSTQAIDPLADGLALRWAADPRQTVAALERAARAWREIPPGASPAEQVRIDAAIFHNTLDLPREELVDKLLYGPAEIKRKVSAAERLLTDVQTAPWEVARARRAFNLLAAAQIQRLEGSPHPFIPNPKGMPAERWRQFNQMVDPNWGLLVLEDGRAVALTPDDLDALTLTTPLLRYASLGRNSALPGQGRTMRRAIWLVLLLRLHQARHDGKLPDSLDEIRARPGAAADLAATPEELSDPYSGKPFGYIASHGQMLLPIGATAMPSSAKAGPPGARPGPAVGCRLLYSVGPDGIDDRAERDVGFDRMGDFVFPLKDDVAPAGGAPG